MCSVYRGILVHLGCYNRILGSLNKKLLFLTVLEAGRVIGEGPFLVYKLLLSLYFLR